MRVLVSAVGTRRDVQPAAAVAVEARRLGQDVRLCVSPDFVDWVAELGFEATPVGVEMRYRPPGLGSPRRRLQNSCARCARRCLTSSPTSLTRWVLPQADVASSSAPAGISTPPPRSPKSTEFPTSRCRVISGRSADAVHTTDAVRHKWRNPVKHTGNSLGPHHLDGSSRRVA